MLFNILIAIAVILAIFLIIASRRPDEFRVTRSAIMAAPIASVFEQVNNLRNWDAWSPWAKLDPNAGHRYEGPEFGKGALTHWSGNSKVGEGNMLITESTPTSHIIFRLEFIRPFKATNSSEFTFRSEGGLTHVSWSMVGKNTFISKIMSLIMNCEKIVGGQFDQGLSQIKAIVEK